MKSLWQLPLIGVLLATPAFGADLKIGDFVMIAKRYDIDRDVFLEGAREGEGEACFQVVEYRENGVFLDHLSGPFTLWWSGEVKEPGSYDDVWFDSDGFKANRPDAQPFDQLRELFKTVPRCE